MDTVKVSIIVPIYNVEPFLDECIQSLIDQTCRDIEIILVNDGSPDKSSVICEKYARIDTRIKYIRQENLGASVARNAGLKAATGEWICFVDGDDWAANDMVASLLACAGGNDIVVGNAYKYEDGRTTVFSFFDGRFPAEKRTELASLIGNALGCSVYGVSGPNIGVPWAKLYRREFLVKNHIEFPVGVKRMQDTVMNIRAFCCAPKICFCGKEIYYYRVTDSSVSHKYTPQFADIAKSVLACIQDMVRENPVQEIRQLYTVKAINLLYENLNLYYWHRDCPLSDRDKIRGIRQLCEQPDYSAALMTYQKQYFSKKRQLSLWLLKHKCCWLTHRLYTMQSKVKGRM